MAAGVFQFGDCTINIASRELRRAGERVNLSPIVFDCIAYLIQHRERAVGRDELVAAVWGKASVSDAVMGKTILTARRAVGDTAEDQRFLRTVPRFGYQWGAPTRSGAEVPVAADEQAAPTSVNVSAGHGVAPNLQATPRPPSKHAVRIAAFIAALVLVAMIGAMWWQRSLHDTRVPASTATAPSALPADMIIVLPAEVAASPEDDWLRLGLMDLLATRLRAGGLAVLPSDNVVRLVPLGTARDAAIAGVRGVAERSHVIVPVLRRSGADWILRAELLEPDGSAHTVQAQTDNAITAAGKAANSLLDLLGKRTPGETTSPAALSQTELLQRVDAARLAGDPAQARALIAAADTNLQSLPEVQLRLGMIDLRTGEFEAARQRLADLAAKVSSEDDALLRARVQSYLCIALARVGQMPAGERACDQAIALLETRDQPAELGRVYSDRGIIRMLLQHYDLASQDFARARIALNLAGDALQLAKVDGNESNLDVAQGNYSEVIAIQQRIGERFERFGMNNELVTSLNNQTDAHLALLQPLDALKTSDRAFALLDRATDASVRYLTRLQRAATFERNGRLGEARVLLDDLIAEADPERYAAERATARNIEAHLELASGQPDAALLLAQQAIPGLPAPPYGEVRASALLTAMRSLHRQGLVEQAAAELKTFTAWANSTTQPEIRLYAQLADAEQAAAENRPEPARASYEQALAQAHRWGVPSALGETVNSFGRFLLAQGDLPKASSVIGLVARYADLDFDAAVLQARLYRALGQQQAEQTALVQARRLAGERPLPAELTAPVPAPGGGKSPSGNNLATR
jgi:DNA-binding winged helix-turn-helix (wHTH) protein/tetratricopeptide (TPR) repeat protein